MGRTRCPPTSQVHSSSITVSNRPTRLPSGAGDEMQLVLDDEIGRSQRPRRHRLDRVQRPLLRVAVAVLQVRRAETVAGAAARDPAEQRLDRALPRQLGELVDRAEQHRRQQPVDLLVDDDHRQPLAWAVAGGEAAHARWRHRRTSGSGADRCRPPHHGWARLASRTTGRSSTAPASPCAREDRCSTRASASPRRRSPQSSWGSPSYPPTNRSETASDPTTHRPSLGRRCGSTRTRRSGLPLAGTAGWSAGAACSA